jgi:hypothetical protein
MTSPSIFLSPYSKHRTIFSIKNQDTLSDERFMGCLQVQEGVGVLKVQHQNIGTPRIFG